MWTIAIWFFAFLFAINGMLLYIDQALPAYSLVSPLTNSTITPPAQPAVVENLRGINGTNGTAYNATSGAQDVGIWDTVTYAWNSTIFVIQLLTGGFLWDVLAIFGLPVILFQMIQGLIAFFMVITVLHFWRGIL